MAATASIEAGKYLIFLLGKEEFAVSVVQVREILPMQVIVATPQARAFVRGEINLRGAAVPVIDLRRRFGLEHIDDTGHTAIVVVNVGGREGPRRIGMVVDGVAEVQSIGAAEIEPPARPYLSGAARSKGKIRLLLDVDRVLGDS